MNAKEIGTAHENCVVKKRKGPDIKERGKFCASWTIEKFRSEQDKKNGKPYEVLRWPLNLLLNEGINELWTIICSAGGTKFDNTNAYLGVGDSSTAAAATQTALQAAVNKLYKGMETGFPTYGTDQKAVWKSSFASAEANFAWEEFTVANGSSDTADNLNRKVESKGTKQSGDVWDLTLEITLA